MDRAGMNCTFSLGPFSRRLWGLQGPYGRCGEKRNSFPPDDFEAWILHHVAYSWYCLRYSGYSWKTVLFFFKWNPQFRHRVSTILSMDLPPTSWGNLSQSTLSHPRRKMCFNIILPFMLGTPNGLCHSAIPTERLQCLANRHILAFSCPSLSS